MCWSFYRIQRYFILNNKENAKLVKKYYEIDHFTLYTTELLNDITKN